MGASVLSVECPPAQGGVINGNDSAFFLERAGSLELIAREGDQAPGTPANAKFDEVLGGRVSRVASLERRTLPSIIK
jgi:hypothetical protein